MRLRVMPDEYYTFKWIDAMFKGLKIQRVIDDPEQEMSCEYCAEINVFGTCAGDFMCSSHSVYHPVLKVIDTYLT